MIFKATANKKHWGAAAIQIVMKRYFSRQPLAKRKILIRYRSGLTTFIATLFHFFYHPLPL